MIEIKEVKEEDVLSIKENHVLSCFTDYLYHKHASDLIQEELVNIAAELSSGSTSTGIIRVSKDKGSCTPWENELLAREAESLPQALTSILRCKESLHNARPQSGSPAQSSKYVRDTSS